MHDIDSNHFREREKERAFMRAGKFAYQKAYRIYHFLLSYLFISHSTRSSDNVALSTLWDKSLLHTRLFLNYFSLLSELI